MRLVVISDTHGLHERVQSLPEADVFIHSGDFMNSGRRYQELSEFCQWLDRLSIPKERRVVIAGNHDIMLDEYHIFNNIEGKAKEYQKVLSDHCVYLQDSACEIDGIKFYGSPWTPEFMGWGFNAARGPEIKQFWDQIPSDTDVLITHGPAFQILDQASPFRNSPHLGCEDLRNTLATMVPNPLLHVFGHIHGSRGAKKSVTNHVGRTYINASYVNEAYRPHIGPGYFLVDMSNGFVEILEG